MIKCPRCFSTLGSHAKAWVCTNQACRSGELDAVASAYAGTPLQEAPLYSDSQADHALRAKQENRVAGPWPPPTPACPKCAQRMSDACYVCHGSLPAHWGQADVTCIVMSGARATGKSLYIAMGVKKLESMLLAHANSQLQPISPEVGRAFDTNYIRPLLEERGVLESTPEHGMAGAYQREPLIFDLGNVRGKRQFVVVRDVAGEDMQNLPTPRTHFEFFGRADAILFLFDPLSIPDVRANLAGVIALPEDAGADPVRVMGNVLTLVREGGNGQKPPPIAVIVSKFDALEEFRNLDDKPQWSELMSHRGAAFARDVSDQQLRYDEDDGDLLSAEIRSLILKLGGAGIVAMLENPHDGRPVDCQYFAVSVLGHAPRGPKLDTRGIAPFRVADPLKWALSRTGAL